MVDAFFPVTGQVHQPFEFAKPQPVDISVEAAAIRFIDKTGKITAVGVEKLHQVGQPELRIQI